MIPGPVAMCVPPFEKVELILARPLPPLPLIHEVIRGHSFRIREVVQFGVQALWPLLSGVRPHDPNVAPPFVDPWEVLDGEPRGEEGVLDDDFPMVPLPPQDSVRAAPAAAAPAASSADAGPSARAPVDPAPEPMDVNFRGDDDDDDDDDDGGDDDDDDDDDDQMEVGLFEDHCIHWYHQSNWNELHFETLWK